MNTKQGVENKIVKIVPGAWVASGQKLILGIQQAKSNLIAQFREKLELPQRLLNVALNEAEALAWETEYPQLVFPTLAEEKITTISDWWHGRKKSLESGYAMAV